MIGYKTGHRKELNSDADSQAQGGQCQAPGTGVTQAADCRNYTVRCQEGFPYNIRCRNSKKCSNANSNIFRYALRHGLITRRRSYFDATIDEPVEI